MDDGDEERKRDRDRMRLVISALFYISLLTRAFTNEGEVLIGCCASV